jgi:glucose-6-phosphate dehydrogenase assembly protein OpcA
MANAVAPSPNPAGPGQPSRSVQHAGASSGDDGPAVVHTWERRDVTIGEVVAALPELRRQADGREAATRTAVLTIVMVIGPRDDPVACAESVRSLGAHHPCRAVVLRPDPDSTPAIDASATLWRTSAAAAEGHPMFFEEVHINVGGQAASHLSSIVGPFILADLPVAMWFPTDLPDPTDPLLRLASVLMVDTRLVGPELAAIGHSYRTLLELANHQPVVDLSWVRLQPWRDLLASLFEPEHSRHFLQGVRLASVKGKPGPRHMLGGWLMAQLDLRAREVLLSDSKHVDITLEAFYDGEEGKFQVSRDEGARAVWAKASLSGGMAHGQAMPLPDDSLTSALSAAIANLRADRVWERALAAAAALAS